MKSVEVSTQGPREGGEAGGWGWGSSRDQLTQHIVRREAAQTQLVTATQEGGENGEDAHPIATRQVSWQPT